MLKSSHAGLAHLGQVRKANEDHWVAAPDVGLFVVADGMGGHVSGGLASKIVVETLPLLVRQKLSETNLVSELDVVEEIKRLLSDLSDRLRVDSMDEPGLRGMGSTVVMLLVRGSQGFIAHMGDSRAYLLRDGVLAQHTADHSLVRLLLESGDITPEEAKTHPARGQITRYVGMDGDPLPEVRFLALKPDDVILLCSDGLTGMVEDDEITKILSINSEPESACLALVDAANAAGGTDNICVLVIRFMDKAEKR